jgi:hypothetical protein
MSEFVSSRTFGFLGEPAGTTSGPRGGAGATPASRG